MNSYLATLSHQVQLPSIFFQNPYLAVTFPVICGGLIGYRTGTIAKEKYGRSALQRMDRQYAYQGTGDLKQPPGKPPAALFGPVWTTIYGLTGLASYLARSNPAARMLYISSLLFNFGRIDIAGGEHLLIAAAWTPLFFGNNRPGYALFDIVALWANIALLIPQWYVYSCAT